MKRFLIAGVALAALTFVGSAAFADPIVLDMKGPGAGNPFWAAVQAGAEEKGKELGVEVVVMSPPAESDVQAQIGQLEDMLAKGIAGLALAPTDPNALAPVVDAAKAKNVPVVFVDTKGTNEGVTFIGTNNEVGAKLAADFICSKVEKGSEVAILQGIITQSTGQARANGSKAGLEACGLKVVADKGNLFLRHLELLPQRLKHLGMGLAVSQFAGNQHHIEERQQAEALKDASGRRGMGKIG